MNPETNNEQIKYCPHCGMRIGEASKNCCIHCGHTWVGMNTPPTPNQNQTTGMEENGIKPFGEKGRFWIQVIGLTNLLPAAFAGLYALIIISYVMVIDAPMDEILKLLPQYFLVGGYLGSSFLLFITACDCIDKKKIYPRNLTKRIIYPFIIVGLLFVAAPFLLKLMQAMD